MHPLTEEAHKIRKRSIYFKIAKILVIKPRIFNISIDSSSLNIFYIYYHTCCKQ